jgi:hypothetical protein
MVIYGRIVGSVGLSAANVVNKMMNYDHHLQIMT